MNHFACYHRQRKQLVMTLIAFLWALISPIIASSAVNDSFITITLCAPDGQIKTIKTPIELEDSPPHSFLMLGEHCPFCRYQDTLVAIPVDIIQWENIPRRMPVVLSRRHETPNDGFVWTPLQARAPPY